MFEATAQRSRGIHGEHEGLGAQLVRVRTDNERLRSENERMRTEIKKLRADNQQLRATLDAHVCRAQSTALFGPIELSAGTCLGPRRRGQSPRGSSA